MIQEELSFIPHEFDKTEMHEIIDNAIYLIEEIMQADPVNLDLVDVANRFKIDTLQMKLRYLKKQI